MLAMADRNGEVHASVPGLAKRAGITMQECETGLACLQAPDAYSRTKLNEGRRIKEIDGGWALLNHGKYRALLSAEERREYNRRKQAEHRANVKNVNDTSMTVNDSQLQSAMSAHTEAESEAKAEATKTVGPNGQAVVPETAKRRVKFTDPEWLESLKADPTYSHVDITFEHGKCARWCEQKRKPLTRMRFLNWIGRIEKPMAGTHTALMR